MTEYINAQVAAHYLGVSEQLIYKQIRRYALKSKKIEGKIFTTTKWLDEYAKDRNNRSIRGMCNGRPVFDEEKGDLSVQMCAKRLGVCRMTILNAIARAELLAVKRGSYYVIRDAHLAEYDKEYRQKKIA